MRVSKPIYEALPWLYLLLGALSVAASFRWREPGWSDALAGFGVIAMVAGLVLVLKRRDFRIQQRRYGGEFDDDE